MISRIGLLAICLFPPLSAQTPGWQLTLHSVPEELLETDTEPEFAPGALVRIYGSSRQICFDPDRTQVRVRPTANTEWRDVALIAEPPSFYDCPPSITIALPQQLSLGPAFLEVRVDGNELLAPLTIIPTRFGILSWEKAPLTRPLAPEAILRITGTGLGLATPSEIHAELDGQPLAFIEARHNTGRDELSFRLPPVIVTSGCYTPVALRIAVRWTRSIPIAATPTGAPCSHPLQLTDSQMAAIDAGRSAALGIIRFISTSSSDSLFQSEFYFATEGHLHEAAFSPQEEGCYDGRSSTSGGPLYPVPLDAGRVTLRLPNGTTTPPPYIGPLPTGGYTIDSTGGRDILPFHTGVKLPPLPQLTRDAQRLPTGELLIEWDPSPYQEGDLVVISRRTICKTRARNGAIRIPDSFFPFPSGFVNIAIERRKDTPLLFPFTLRNGSQFWGVLDYIVAGTQSFRIVAGGSQ